jgi:hypothetical protein
VTGCRGETIKGEEMGELQRQTKQGWVGTPGKRPGQSEEMEMGFFKSCSLPVCFFTRLTVSGVKMEAGSNVLCRQRNGVHMTGTRTVEKRDKLKCARVIIQVARGWRIQNQCGFPF